MLPENKEDYDFNTYTICFTCAQVCELKDDKDFYY